jgi:serine/threonine protein kinase
LVNRRQSFSIPEMSSDSTTIASLGGRCVNHSRNQPNVTAERRWEETLRQASATAPTPFTSLTAGPVAFDLEPAQRVRAAIRARAAHAGAADSDGADYLLGDLLGAGGMGRVYAARQVALDRTVAVKVLQPELQADDAARQEFLAEALVAADLDHPNTVPVYDIGRTGESELFCAMKLVRGTAWNCTLAAQTLEQNVGILLKVCDAVSFAHDKGVIHRDLKPENVMLGAYGEVLLMDWGLAASVGGSRARRLNADNMLAGTPAFMAPEVAACALERVGPASDIYLLGGILYQSVTDLAPQ